MAERTNGNGQAVTLSGIRQWLPLLLTIAALLVSLGIAQQRIQEIERVCDENRAQLRTHDATFLELQVRLAEMQKDLSYIRLTLDRLDPSGG